MNDDFELNNEDNSENLENTFKLDEILLSEINDKAKTNNIEEKKEEIDEINEVTSTDINTDTNIDELNKETNEEKNEVNPNSKIEDHVSTIFSETKKKKNKFPIIILIIFILLAILCLVYKFVILTPKNIFIKEFSLKYLSLSHSIDNLNNNKFYQTFNNSNKMLVNSSLKIGNKDDNLNELTEMINYKLGIDKTNKLFNIKFLYSDINNNDNDLDVALYGTDGNIYLYLKDIYDKYIKFKVDEYNTLFDERADIAVESEYIIEKINHEVFKSIDNKNITSSSEEILIDGNNLKTKKYQYRLTEKEITEKIITIINNLKDDEKFINSLAKLIDKSNIYTINLLDNYIKILESIEYESNKYITFNMYTTSILEKLVKFDILIDDDTLFSYENYQDYTLMNFSDIILKIKDNNINISYSDYVLNINLTENNQNKIVANYEFIESNDMLLSGNITIYNIEDNSKYINDIKLTMDDVIYNLNYSISFNDEIENIDISNSIDYKDLSREDIDNIYKKIFSSSLFETRESEAE